MSDEYDCSGSPCASFINSTRLLANTSETADCTAVHVACPVSGQELANKISVYRCFDGKWAPFAPLSCYGDNSDSNVNTGIVIGCTIGALVCLAIVVFSIVAFIRLWRQNKEDEERDKVMEDKMKYVREYTTSIADWNCSEYPREIPTDSDTSHYQDEV